MQAFDTNNGVKVYDLCVGKSLPQWLTGKQKASLRKDAEFRRRIELVQDFYFNASSGRVRMTADATHIVATGVYPPQVKVYDTRQLSIKFERHLDAEVVDFAALADDYTKLVFLGVNRTLDFHAAYGMHYRLRVPRFGRALAYDPFGCELFVAASGNEVFRVDLEQGRFSAPYETVHERGVNAIGFSEPLQLLACGGESDGLSMWDVRAQKQVGLLDIEAEITALQLEHSTGLTMAVGTAQGEVSLYDIRSSRPLLTKQHPNQLPIKSIQLQHSGRLVVSADAKSIRIWNRDNGSSFTNIEPSADVNDVFLVDTGGSGPLTSSGLLMVAGETDRIMSFYVPRLGPAPKWISYLDNLTEELEETHRKSDEVYENYKFVQQADLERLGVANLIGTPLLRAYMHGYFMDMRLYKRIKAVSEPLAFREYRKNKIKERIEAKVGQRIARKKPEAAKVNNAFAERAAETIKGDSRFTAMFEDDDFAIDEESDRFKQLYPSGLAGTVKAGLREGAEDMDSDRESTGEAEEGEGESESEAEAPPAKKRAKLVVSAAGTGSASELLGQDQSVLAEARAKRKAKRAQPIKDKLREGKREEIRALPGGNREAVFEFAPEPGASAGRSPGKGGRGGKGGGARRGRRPSRR